MKLIKQSFEIIPQESSLEGIYKQIEKAGRTCYRSEDKITEDSAKKFVDMLTTNCHGAMLEHGTVYLTIPGEYEPDEWGRTAVFLDYKGSYRYNKYSKVVFEHWDQEPVGTQCEFCRKIGRSRMHITTNYRVLVENGWLGDLKYQCEPTEYHEKRVTVKFTTDQGIMREFIRHRTMSFAVESTRYCNYSKDKFGNELTFIIPNWLQLKEGSYTYNYPDGFTFNGWKLNGQSEFNTFLIALARSEKTYLDLIEYQGWKPQQARNILPLATKCEMVMTGFVSDWKHFFELRCDSASHPQARELAIPLQTQFKEYGYI